MHPLKGESGASREELAAGFAELVECNIAQCFASGEAL
jgi:hypothetical protein